MLTDIILLCTGVLVGAMNAIAGGGGLVGFPVLLAFGLPALTANATGYVAVLPGQISSVWGYRKYLRNVPKLYALLLIPCVFGCAIGAYLLRSTSFGQFEHLVPFLVLLSVIIFALQPLLHFHLLSHIRARHKNALKFGILALVVFLMTIYGGYFGAGFGFAILALIGFTNIREIHTMNAMKNVSAIVISVVAIIMLTGANIIDWQYALIMAVGTLFGGYLGAKLALHVPSIVVRCIVITIGLVTTCYLMLRYH